jgi:hypothetical protein
LRPTPDGYDLSTLAQGAAGLPPVAYGVVSQFSAAKEKLQPIADAFTAVPGWLWGGAAMALATYLFMESRKIIDQRVAMHQNGETA